MLMPSSVNTIYTRVDSRKQLRSWCAYKLYDSNVRNPSFIISRKLISEIRNLKSCEVPNENSVLICSSQISTTTDYILPWSKQSHCSPEITCTLRKEYTCILSVRKAANVLMRLRNFIPTRTKLQLFKAAILPYLTYSHLVWHFCRASERGKLERIQERALRVTFCDKTSNYDKLLVMGILRTLQNRRLKDLATLMYKDKHNICPRYVANLFRRTETKYALRNKEFVIPRFKTVTYGKHTIRYTGPKI